MILSSSKNIVINDTYTTIPYIQKHIYDIRIFSFPYSYVPLYHPSLPYLCTMPLYRAMPRMFPMPPYHAPYASIPTCLNNNPLFPRGKRKKKGGRLYLYTPPTLPAPSLPFFFRFFFSCFFSL